jgi:predicted AlkP superfamily phosphohydrolase/phosphomutase
VLVLFNFDSVSEPLVERLLAEGRLPALAGLRERGTTLRLRSPADRFPTSVYPTLYTGLTVARHGIYYPFQWSPGEQRVHYADRFSAPPSIWDRLAGTRRRVLVVDPYESRRPARAEGLFLSGWQFRNRIVLPPWSVPRGAHARLQRRYGRSPRLEEVFGTQSAATLLEARRCVLAGPGRVARLVLDRLARESFDLAWLSFPSTHFAGHHFWDLSAVSDGDASRLRAAGAETTLVDSYVAADAAIGRVLEPLPDDADVIVFSALGMSANSSLSDLLPGMLAAALAGGRPAAARKSASAGPLWRFRAALPTDLRAAVAQRLPRPLVLNLTARLESRMGDWSRVRAFVVPSDATGYIRLNLRGREREGIVDPADADSLIDEIAAGLTTFVDPDGRPVVAGVERLRDLFGGDEARLELLPDVIVHWGDRSSARLRRVTSPEFGEVERYSTGSGRAGNHTADAWATIVPGRARLREQLDTPEVADLPATVLGCFGLATDDLDGEPLLVR